jgi:hypothetical protein
MALTKCRECGHQVSTQAAACPSCGAKPKTFGFLKFVLFGFLLLVALAVVGATVNTKRSVDMLTVDAATGAKVRPESLAMAVAPEATPPAAEPPPPTKKAPPAEVPGSQWSYSAVEDSMGKGRVLAADVLSTNEVEFDFPYHGPQRALLVLRTHPRHGKDVMFRIQRGQLVCPPFEDCQVLVRFDDEAAVRYSASSPDDHSSEVLFIANYSRFYEKVLKSNRVRISANVFHEGTRMFEFNLKGFDPARYQSAQPKP